MGYSLRREHFSSQNPVRLISRYRICPFPSHMPDSQDQGPRDLDVRFKSVLHDHLSSLREEQCDEFNNFSGTTFDDVVALIMHIQREHYAKKRRLNFRRLKRFLDTMNKLNEILEVFSNKQILSYVWGSFKLLLQVRSSFVLSKTYA